MALQSQSPRTGINRRYPMSNKRKKGLAPWMVLVGVAIIIGGLVVLFNTGGSTTNAADDNDDDNDKQADQDKANNNGQTTGVSGKTKKSSGQTDQSVSQRKPAQTRTSSQVDAQYKEGLELLDKNDYINGRRLLSGLLFQDGALPFHEKKAICERLIALNKKFIFSPSSRNRKQIEADPILTIYPVRRGDNLIGIGKNFRIPSKLLMRMNGIKDPRHLQADQQLKVLSGPVHAMVDKSEYRLYLFVNDKDGEPIFLNWFHVGLGEENSTPVGMWRVKKGGKVGPENGGPDWTNPRAKPGEKRYYKPTDPDNPLGEYWIGLEGTDENTKKKQSYGIHATIDPDSIGQQESMGCIRMRDPDVDAVFYSLYELDSTVEIVR